MSRCQTRGFALIFLQYWPVGCKVCKICQDEFFVFVSDELCDTLNDTVIMDGYWGIV